MIKLYVDFFKYNVAIYKMETPEYLEDTVMVFCVSKSNLYYFNYCTIRK